MLLAPPTTKNASISESFNPASASTPAVFSAWICAVDRSGMTRSGCSNAPTMYALPLMLTYSSSCGNFDVHLGEGLDFLEGEAVGHLVDDELAVAPPQNSQVRDHDVHAVHASQRILAALHELRATFAVAVLHHDDELLLASHQVHRPADTAEARVAQAEVGEIAVLVDLVRAQDDRVELAAAGHLERRHAVEVGDTRQRLDELSRGVEDVVVDTVAGDHLA